MKKIKLLMFSTILILVGQSCSKDFLEKDPLGSQTQGFYAVEENAIAAVNAIYDAAAWNESNETGGWANEFIYNDVLSDDAVKGSNSGDFPDITVLEEWRTTTANPMPGQVWRKIFRGIFRANDVINGLTNTEGIDEETKSRLL